MYEYEYDLQEAGSVVGGKYGGFSFPFKVNKCLVTFSRRRAGVGASARVPTCAFCHRALAGRWNTPEEQIVYSFSRVPFCHP